MNNPVRTATRLEGLSLVVTGAARGVGAATALGAAAEGARVVAVDLEDDGLRTVAIRAKAEGLTLETLVADVASVAGNQRAVEMAESHFGRLNAFIANAAVIRFVQPLDTTEQDWDQIHRVNLKGVYLGIQAAVPALRRAGGGSLVLIASVLGIVGDPQLSAYGATKGGLRALCRSIAVAHGADNIRCNTICPGDVETQMMTEQLSREPNPDAARRSILASYPLRRFAQPRDVANAAVFLASDMAAYITGTDLIVDGGLLARCY